MPAPIMFNEIPLPWEDSWPHLGNELDRFNLATKVASHLDKDLEIKRRKFIGKYHSLKQEFGFSSSEVLLKLVNIYATSFYGSVLWDLNGAAEEKLFTSWNVLIRDIWKIPNNSHRYFIEEVSGTHLRSALSQRYLTFFH